jgi:hypothetical protein
VSIDIGDKMSRELKSYGANILIEPAGQAALPALFSENSNPLSGQDFLDEAELPTLRISSGATTLSALPLCLAVMSTLTAKKYVFSAPSSANR